MTARPCKYVADIDNCTRYQTSRCVDADEARAEMVKIYGTTADIRIVLFQFTD